MKVTWIPVFHVWVRKKEQLDSHQARRMNKDVKQNGIINPITVMRMGSRYLLIDGRYRLRAAKKCGMERIPAYVQPRMCKDALSLYIAQHNQEPGIFALG